MKDLQSINLKGNLSKNCILKIFNVSEKERYEFIFPLMNDIYGECSAMNFNDEEWEHVMLNSQEHERCPTYAEMSALKETFWKESEIAIQVHPKKSDYVNLQKYSLHLWRNKMTTEQAEARLKRNIINVCNEAKTYYSGERKEVFLDEWNVLVIFCGEDWLSWNEVCQIKQKYWKPQEAAIQFNISPEFDLNMEHMILLWDATNFDLPPKELV